MADICSDCLPDSSKLKMLDQIIPARVRALNGNILIMNYTGKLHCQKCHDQIVVYLSGIFSSTIVDCNDNVVPYTLHLPPFEIKRLVYNPHIITIKNFGQIVYIEELTLVIYFYNKVLESSKFAFNLLMDNTYIGFFITEDNKIVVVDEHAEIVDHKSIAETGSNQFEDKHFILTKQSVNGWTFTAKPTLNTKLTTL